MPVSFFLLGLLVLISLFSFREKWDNFAVFIGLIAMMIGFFFGEIRVGNLIVNIPSIIGILVFLLGVLVVKGYVNYLKILLLALGCGCIYFSLNAIDIELNVFFNILPVMITINLISIICECNLKEKIVLVVLANVLCEIINVITMVEHLDFWALFGGNFILCIVLCILLQIVINLSIFLIKKLATKKYCDKNGGVI